MDNNFIHTYWSSNSDAVNAVPYFVSNNMSKLSSHIKDTLFISILWCNTKAFKSLKAKQAQTKAYYNLDQYIELIENHNPKANKLPTIKCLRELLPNGTEVFINTLKSHFIVIDFESYLKNRANEKSVNMPNRSEAYNLLLNLYQKCNQRQIFAFVKDHIISLIFLELYGFYFDIDKVPHGDNDPFFKSFDNFCQIPYISEEIRMMKQNKKTKYFGLATFLDVNPDQREIGLYGDDVGFQFAVYNTYLRPTIDLDKLKIEDFQIDSKELEESYQEFVEYMTVDFPEAMKDSLPYFYLKKDKKYYDNPSVVDHMKQFGSNKYDWANDAFFNAQTSGKTDPLRYASQIYINECLTKIYSLVALLYPNEFFRVGDHGVGHPEILEARDFYVKFYRENLYRKFDQQYISEPSSFYCTGYQQLEKYQQSVKLIKDKFSNSRQSNIQRFFQIYGTRMKTQTIGNYICYYALGFSIEQNGVLLHLNSIRRCQWIKTILNLYMKIKFYALN